MKYHKLLFIVTLIVAFSCSDKSSDNRVSTDANDLSGQEDERFIDTFLASLDMEVDYELDLEGIKERDTLKAITTYSPTSYFLYKGRPMGYEYELAQRLAEHLDVHLEMVVAKNIDAIFQLLNSGEGDVIMHNLTVTKRRKEFVDFTLPLNYTHQVLVQKKPDNWRKMKLHEIEEELLRNPIKLLGKTIHVRANSSYRDRLLNLQEELGGDINVEYLPGELTTSEIIQKVSEGEIDYTIADFNLANINKSYYTNLDIETTVGVMTRLAWAVRKNSPDLLAATNEWIKSERNNTDFYVIYNKYFKNSRAYTRRVKSDFFSIKNDKISEYDDMIKDASDEVNWDWRLLASQIYQESQFDPKEKSWAGAVGLMQLMPRTAKSYGFTNLTKPQSNINAGVMHIQYLQDYWSDHIQDSTERMKFVLGSYNVGHNHVQDARRLAVKHGMDPDIWYDNVEEALLMKSKKKFFNDDVVKYGYCRGEEPVNYVKEIFERYNYYTEFIEDQEGKNYVSSL